MILILAIFFVVLSLFSTYRLFKGPTITDRLVAADAIGIFLAMVMLLIALHFDIYLLVDIVLAYAVLLFVEILIFAKFFEHKELYK